MKKKFKHFNLSKDELKDLSFCSMKTLIGKVVYIFLASLTSLRKTSVNCLHRKIILDCEKLVRRLNTYLSEFDRGVDKKNNFTEAVNSNIITQDIKVQDIDL